jgi:hypothetical protein
VLVFVGLVALTFGIVLSQAPRANALVYWTTLNDAPHYQWSVGVARLDGTGSSNYFIRSDDIDDGTVQNLTLNSNHIYWGSHGGVPVQQALGRANLDGSGFDPALIDLGALGGYAAPTDLAATEAYVYWVDLSRNSIGRATAVGGGVDYSFIDSVEPGGIAATDDHIYWRSCTNEVGVVLPCHLGSEWIARANSDGSGIDHKFLAADPRPSATMPSHGLAVSSSHIYWSNSFPTTGGPPAIARAPIDGGAVDETFIDLPAGRYGAELAVGNGYIYWADYNGGTIGRARLDGSAVDPNFITVAPNDDSFVRPIDVAVDSRTQLPPLDGLPGGGDDDEACAKAKAELKQAKKRLQKAKKKLKTAKKKLKKAKRTGTNSQAAKAKKKVKKAKKKVKKAKKKVEEARENVERACG